MTAKTADPRAGCKRHRLTAKTAASTWHFANEGAAKRRRLTAKTADPCGAFAGRGSRRTAYEGLEEDVLEDC